MAKISIKEALAKVMQVTKQYIDSLIPTEEEVLHMLMESDVVQPVADENNTLFTDNDGNTFIL